MYLRKSVKLSNGEIIIETGKLAKQADGSALVRQGDTVVLVTAVSAREAKESADFFPLTVDYIERTYSAGKIPGGYFKREGKPSEFEVLMSRLIDRTIRPLFTEGYRCETQVVALVLSADKEHDPAILSIIGASAALHCSDIPFNGPVGAVRVGKNSHGFNVNPTFSERSKPALDIVVSGSNKGLVMVEGEAEFISEDDLVQALLFAQESIDPIMRVQEEMKRELSVAKREFKQPEKDAALISRIRENYFSRIKESLNIKEKLARRRGIDELFKQLAVELGEEYKSRMPEIKGIFEEFQSEILRGSILDSGRRIDGRGPKDIRGISCEAGVLPRTHGSALFTRGETQALVSVTLGTSEDEQRLDLLTGETTKTFMLHYNFPPFCVGEVKSLRQPSRREVGHAHLAERGITHVLPPKDEKFPYTLRIVSEILESNGSSSMATVCGSSLALMDAGVPVKGHIAGIAMGMIKEGDKCVILSDILGDEDHLGDMDFKVVGNEDGITSVQMDIKMEGLSGDLMKLALDQAREGRLHILGKMREAIAAPRPEFSIYAPKFYTITISQDRIKDLIGPGGKNIRGIIEKTGASIEVEQS
ncbi:MAG: polyribonucleotide nucleotidyltransferase, partial [Deltaproteobacteria bacterium]|nr:polyribonucleotide nucleotidyltransferase [Deltaproteobacteria bacterium]